MEKFKEFAIVPFSVGSEEVSWTLVYYNNPEASDTYITIAYIRFSPSDDFTINSVGMRLAEYATTPVLKWIIAWTDYQRSKKYWESEE